MSDTSPGRRRSRTIETPLAALARATLLLGLIGTPGCAIEHTCTAQAISALVITVTQTPGGTRVCDAMVTARDGAFSEVLTSFGDTTDCTYAGVYERKGTYSIDVMSAGTTKTIDGVSVTADDCHVITRHITVAVGQ